MVKMLCTCTACPLIPQRYHRLDLPPALHSPPLASLLWRIAVCVVILQRLQRLGRHNYPGKVEEGENDIKEDKNKRSEERRGL